MAGRQRAHNIDVNMREPLGGHRNSRKGRTNVSLNLTSMTAETKLCPETHVMGKARPNKLGGDQPPRGMYTRV